MKVAFRVDASLQIGTGHVMRCLTLAEALKENGAQCIFVCRQHGGNLIDTISQSGFETRRLAIDDGTESTDERAGDNLPMHGAWLGSNQEIDAQQTLDELSAEQLDWLIVDHYALDERWEKNLRPITNSLMAIDDLADRRHDCDLLLDQNLGRTQSDYSSLVPKSCVILVGPTYALLRPEFAAHRPASLSRRTSGVVRQILVTMGGVDKDNATGKVLAALEKAGLPGDCKVIVVMGATAPWLSAVRHQANLASLRVEVRENVTDMAELMTESDLAIGAAGSTSWERCCLGLPAIIVTTAENQRNGARALDRVGAAKLIGSESDIETKLPAAVESLGVQTSLLEMSVSASSVTDGMGVHIVRRTLEAANA